MSAVIEKLRRGLPAFLNPDDAVVSALQGADESILSDAEATLEEVHTILGILGATGTDLDDMTRIYGITRLSGESDAHEQQRLNLLLQEGGVSPQGIQNQLSAIHDAATFYEPAGGSFVGWDINKNFRYDRSTVTPTFTRNSTATYGGTTYQANQPVWLAQGSMYWVGVFPANGATGATVADVLTIPAASVIGTQSQGMIAIGIQDGTYGPTITGSGTYTNPQYLLDYGGTFSVWFDGQEWHWLIGGVTLSGTAGMGVDAAHMIVLNWGQSEAQLVIDGVVIDSAAVSSPPTSVTGNVYIGSDSSGANQISAFLGNFAFLEASWPLSRIQQLSATLATPVYAQTIFSGAFFSQSLTGIEGGMINGVSNYVGVYVPSSSNAGFTLDTSTLNVNSLASVQTTELDLAQNIVFPLFAGGIKTFLWTPGQQT